MIIIENIWKRLQNEKVQGEDISARLAYPDLSKKIYAGLDAQKLRHFLIPITEEEELTDSKNTGITILSRNLNVLGGTPSKYIDIQCNDTSGHLIFDAIGHEIAQSLDKGLACEVVMRVIHKWRRFWGKIPRDMLSYEQMMGLFAELWFLNHWLLPKLDPIEAINSWRGPFSSRHDFEMQGKSIESKATTNQQSRIHKVNGIDQLSAPENGSLMFFSLRLREERGAENNLPKLIEFIREKLKNNIDALSKFENALAVVGYSPAHDDEYSKFKFRIVDQRLFEVSDDFPKITKESFIAGLPDSIGAVEYTINLDGYDRLCVAKSPEDDFSL